MEGRRRGGGTCAVKSQPGKPECPRTAQHRSYICWLATLRNMHDTRLTPPTTASTRLQVCLFWDKISQPNYHKTVTNRQFFLARFARETAGPDRPPARNSGVRPKKCPPENLLLRMRGGRGWRVGLASSRGGYLASSGESGNLANFSERRGGLSTRAYIYNM